MPRYRLTVEYDGRFFCGWQRQENVSTVQQSLEEAAEKFCNHTVTVQGAGRTDTGVHAIAQTAHIDFEKNYPPDQVRDALNFHLRRAGYAVAISEACVVDDDFHARFSAKERAYLYRILNRRAQPVLEQGRVWWVARPLDATSMHIAAQVLIGHHDFSSFRAAECQAQSPFRTLSSINVERHGDEIHLRLQAPSFLHNQIRIITGTLRLVGEGKWTAEKVQAALEARNRVAAGETAPAYGLYFMGVRYEGDEDIL